MSRTSKLLVAVIAAFALGLMGGALCRSCFAVKGRLPACESGGAPETDSARILLPLPSREPVLRVWLSSASAAPEVACEGPCLILPQCRGVQGRNLTRLDPAKAELAKGAIRIGAELFRCGVLDLQPHGDVPVQVDGHAYPGRIRLAVAGDRVAAINIVGAETYLLGVLGSEMPQRWPAESLKAQAVAARTYALYYCQERAGAAWDLQSTVEDQVYRGAQAQSPRIRQVVAATRGQVLLHEGELFPAFFHSTCGGATEAPGKAIAKPEFDFLDGVACDFCKHSPHYRWRASLTGAEIAEKLAAVDITVGRPITDVIPVTIGGASSRAVKVVWEGGEDVVPIVDFRRAVGRMRVRSGKFECYRQGERFFFEGRGLGHGAGMCQYGARGMAIAKHTYAQILAHYYKRATLKRLY